ncbi:MAG: efflux RND transporter periplasmic adaptor subunit [Pseudomonadota bacterium]
MKPQSRLMKRKWLWLLLAGSAVAAGLWLLGEGKAIPVKVTELKPDELRVIVNATTTSTVKSEIEVTLSAQRTGRVVKLPVREGDRVKAGDIITRLDLSEESVQTQSNLEQSKANFREAEKNKIRAEALFNKSMIAQQDLDAARRTHEVARAQYRAAMADAEVKQKYSIIRTPFDGVVAQKYTEVGELLLPGSRIVMIVHPEQIYVLATIDEVDLGRLRPDQPVSITVDAFPGETFQGHVGRISPIVSGGKLETRTADVWVYFNEPQPRIKPGMSADVEILVMVLSNVLSVPSQAIIERDGKKQIYCAAGSALKPGDVSRAVLKPVEIGETNWSFTQITGGLAAGEQVITTPEAEGLKDQARIKIEPDEIRPSGTDP